MDNYTFFNVKEESNNTKLKQIDELSNMFFSESN